MSPLFAFARLARLCRNAYDHNTIQEAQSWEFVEFTRHLVLEFSTLLAEALGKPSQDVEALHLAFNARFPGPQTTEYARLQKLIGDETQALVLVLDGAASILREDPRALDVLWTARRWTAVVFTTEADKKALVASHAAVSASGEPVLPLQVDKDVAGTTRLVALPDLHTLMTSNSSPTILAYMCDVQTFLRFMFCSPRPVLVTNKPSALAAALAEIQRTDDVDLIVPLSWPAMSATLKQSASSIAPIPRTSVPRPSGDPHFLGPQALAACNEWAELVGVNTGAGATEQVSEQKAAFARGGLPVPWSLLLANEASPGQIVHRAQLQDLQSFLLRAAASLQRQPRVGVIRLRHEAGTGATTLARHALFSMRREYATLYAKDAPTTDRLADAIKAVATAGGSSRSDSGVNTVVVVFDDVPIGSLLVTMEKLGCPILLVEITRVPSLPSGPPAVGEFVVHSRLTPTETAELDKLFRSITGSAVTIQDKVKEYEVASRAKWDESSSLPPHIFYFGLCYFVTHYDVSHHVAAWLSSVAPAPADGFNALPKEIQALVFSCLVHGFASGRVAISKADLSKIMRAGSFDEIHNRLCSQVSAVASLLVHGSAYVRTYHDAISKAVALYFCPDVLAAVRSLVDRIRAAKLVFSSGLVHLVCSRLFHGGERDHYSLVIQHLMRNGQKDEVLGLLEHVEATISSGTWANDTKFEVRMLIVRWLTYEEQDFSRAFDKLVTVIETQGLSAAQASGANCLYGDFCRLLLKHSVPPDDQLVPSRSIRRAATQYIESLKLTNTVALLGLLKLTLHMVTTEAEPLAHVFDYGLSLLDICIVFLELSFHTLPDNALQPVRGKICGLLTNITSAIMSNRNTPTTAADPQLDEVDSGVDLSSSSTTSAAAQHRLYDWLVYVQKGPFPIDSTKVDGVNDFVGSYPSLPSKIRNGGSVPTFLALLLHARPDLAFPRHLPVAEPRLDAILSAEQLLLQFLWMARAWVLLKQAPPTNDKKPSIAAFIDAQEASESAWKDKKAWDQRRFYYIVESSLTPFVTSSHPFTVKVEQFGNQRFFRVAEFGIFKIPLDDRHLEPAPGTRQFRACVGLFALGMRLTPP